MEGMDFYKEFWQRSFDFKGVTSRRDYWMVVLTNFCIGFVMGVLSSVPGVIYIYFLFNVLLIVPYLSMMVRRLHDVGKSGWMILTGLIPLVGPVVLLVLSVLPSKEHDNPYRDQGGMGGMGNQYTSNAPVSFHGAGGNLPGQPQKAAAPMDPEVQGKMAQAHQLLTSGRYQESVQAYMQIAKSHPEQKAECATNIGSALYYAGDYENALKYYTVAKKYGADPQKMNYNIQEAKQALKMSA